MASRLFVCEAVANHRKAPGAGSAIEKEDVFNQHVNCLVEHKSSLFL